MAESIIENYLKAPSTAEFSAYPEVRYDANRKIYSLIGNVDAENSFGAMLRNDYVIIFRPICDSVYSKGCWDVLKLGIGDRIFVNKPLPEKRSRSTSTSTDLSRAQTRILQEGLQDAGFDPGPIDGLLGSKTRAAIEAYQKAHGLAVTGKPSEELIKKVRKKQANNKAQ